MADIFVHGAVGGVLAWWASIFPGWRRWTQIVFICVSIVLGALPDLIGAYGNYILHDGWQLYNLAHHASWLNTILWFIPPCAAHLLIDWPFHALIPGGHWWPSLAWLDILLWLVTLFLGYRIWKAGKK